MLMHVNFSRDYSMYMSILKKKRKRKKDKLFEQRQNPYAGTHKNWSEWRKRHERRWTRKTVLIKKETKEGFLQQEIALPEKEPPWDYHHWHGEESYHNRGRRCSKSCPKYNNDDNGERDRRNSRPHSILKKNVRFPAEEQKGRGRGGRVRRGGCGGRGDACDGYRRGHGSRS